MVMNRDYRVYNTASANQHTYCWFGLIPADWLLKFFPPWMHAKSISPYFRLAL